MKKLLKTIVSALIISALTLTALSACKTRDDGIKKIAIIQISENGSFTEMNEAYTSKLKELGYDKEKITVETFNANGDVTQLTSIIQNAVNNYDILVPMTTLPAVHTFSYLQNNGIKKPIIFMSVTDPVTSGLMSSLKTPDKNATGTSNVVPTEKIFSFAKEFKDIKKYGIIYDESNSAAVNTANNAEKYLNANSVECVKKTIVNLSELSSATTSLIESNVDAIYVPLDSKIQQSISSIVTVANEANVPVIGSADVMVIKGALATVGVSYTKIGNLTAEITAEYLGGKDISQLPAKALTEYIEIVNSDTADILGIEIPDSLTEKYPNLLITK